VAGVAFVGYHTGAGAEGVLAHTYLANSLTGVWVDGRGGEARAISTPCRGRVRGAGGPGDGDDLACRDAAGYAPAAPTAAVKDCVSRYARCAGRRR